MLHDRIWNRCSKSFCCHFGAAESSTIVNVVFAMRFCPRRPRTHYRQFAGHHKTKISKKYSVGCEWSTCYCYCFIDFIPIEVLTMVVLTEKSYYGSPHRKIILSLHYWSSFSDWLCLKLWMGQCSFTLQQIANQRQKKVGFVLLKSLGIFIGQRRRGRRSMES